LTTGGFDTTNNACSEDGTAGGAALDPPINSYVECELCFQVVSADVANTDTIDIRVLFDGALDTWTQIPRITVLKSVPVDVTTIQTLRTDVVNLKTPVLVTERSPTPVGTLRSTVLNPLTPVITTERSPTNIVTRALFDFLLKTPTVAITGGGTDATISVTKLTELLQLQSPSVAALRNPTTVVSRVLETFVLKTPVVFAGQLVSLSALKALLALQAPVVVASRSPTMVMAAGGLRLTTKAPKVTIVGVSTGRRGAHRQHIRGAIAGHRGGM